MENPSSPTSQDSTNTSHARCLNIAHCILDLDTNKQAILQKINYYFGISETRDNIFHPKIQRSDTLSNLNHVYK